MLFVCHPKILHKHSFQLLLGVEMAQRETENNAYAKFWGDKQRALCYVMVFSAVVNCIAQTVQWRSSKQQRFRVNYNLKKGQSLLMPKRPSNDRSRTLIHSVR